MKISLNALKSQYARVKKDGWLPIIAKAAKLSNTTTAHWLAFGSRESNLKNIRGDFRNGVYNGFGPVQVDIGTDPVFAKTWSASSKDSLERGFIRGAEIYNLKKDQILKGRGKKLTVRSRTFTGKKIVQDDDLRRIATAAYNCGLWAFYHFSNGNHVDSTTTGKDYSRDVYDRAIEFAVLLEADGEKDALKMEVHLQGKYARNEHRKRAGFKEITEAEAEMSFTNAMDSDANLQKAGYATEEDFSDIVPVNPPAEENNTLGQNVETIQQAENIINAPTGDQAAETAKIEAAKSAPPVLIPATEPTGFIDKVKKLVVGVATGTIALPFLDKFFGIQLTPESVELMKFIFPYIFFGVIVALIAWYITKKVNNFKLTQLIAEKNADMTQRNIALMQPSKPKLKPVSLIRRIQYAVTAKPAYIWMQEDSESSESGQPNQPLYKFDSDTN